MKRAHVLLSLGLLTGCAGLIGVPDLTFDDDAGQGNPDGGSRLDGTTSPDGTTTSTPDGGDANTPACDTTKLQTDSKHCGRCGHDCLGGACNAGTCESVVVRGGLENPVDLAVDSAGVYVTSRGNGTVLRIAKDGSKTDVLASGHKEARGVTLDGQNLYWSNMDYPGDGGDGSWGGVWGCTLPACADKRLVTTGDWAANVRFSAGFLYFAENNNSAVVRVKDNGTSRTSIASPTQPFSVAVDDQHVYYSANNGNLERVSLMGGSSEDVGPIEIGSSLGFVTVDAERVYWAYTADNGDGHVYSALKAMPASPKEQYGTANKGSIGVAADATTLFWTNQGTFSGSSSNKDGEILACPKSGCGGAAPVVLQKALLCPGAITVDGDAIYFLTFGTQSGAADGELRRIAKP